MSSINTSKQPSSSSSSSSSILLTATAVLATVLLVYVSFQHHDDDEYKQQRGNKQNRKNQKDKKKTYGSSSKMFLDAGVGVSLLPPHLLRELEKDQRRMDKLSSLAMKKPMYDNVKMFDPSGEMLSTISKKKARWYVNKGLASWISKDQSENSSDQIQLNFEPRARSNEGEMNELYHKNEKKNECVVCSGQENHVRHYVVPSAYRHFFPPNYKNHMSHDIVLLCGQCNIRCSSSTQRRMNEIDSRFCPKSKFIVDKELAKVNKYARALLHHQQHMPQSKIEEYEDVILKYLLSSNKYNLTSTVLSKELLQYASEIEYETLNPSYVSGAELMVRSLNDDDEKLTLFVKEWRKFFVSTMNPKFLPIGWSVDHPVRSRPN